MRGLKLIFFLLTYVSASKSFHFEISATKSSSHLHRRSGSLFPTQKQIDGNEAFQLSKLSSSANDESFANIESVGNATIPLSINRNIRPNDMDSLSSFEHVISKAIQQKSGPDPTTKCKFATRHATIMPYFTLMSNQKCFSLVFTFMCSLPLYNNTFIYKFMDVCDVGKT